MNNKQKTLNYNKIKPDTPFSVHFWNNPKKNMLHGWYNVPCKNSGYVRINKIFRDSHSLNIATLPISLGKNLVLFCICINFTFKIYIYFKLMFDNTCATNILSWCWHIWECPNIFTIYKNGRFIFFSSILKMATTNSVIGIVFSICSPEKKGWWFWLKLQYFTQGIFNNQNYQSISNIVLQCMFMPFKLPKLLMPSNTITMYKHLLWVVAPLWVIEFVVSLILSTCTYTFTFTSLWVNHVDVSWIKSLFPFYKALGKIFLSHYM